MEPYSHRDPLLQTSYLAINAIWSHCKINLRFLKIDLMQ